MNDIRAIEPLAGYVGGKRRLAKTIVNMINQIPHERYVEPFLGMGGIFLRRNKIVVEEVINDINKDIINLFRVVQRHKDALIELCQWQLSSRDEFYRLRTLPRESLTDIERAFCFLYLQKHAFAGNVDHRSMKLSGSSFNIYLLEKKIRLLHKRLSKVFIECSPYDEFILRQDKANTLHYLDPPYLGTERYYGNQFSKDDFYKLADMLKNVKGSFILSINNTNETRDIFKDFYYHIVPIKYSCNARSTKINEELIVSNHAFNFLKF